MSYPGNIMPAPGFKRGAHVPDEEIMASMAGYTQHGMTVAPGQGILPRGCAMARRTSDKLWVRYNNAGSGGAEQCRGILRQTLDTDGPDAPYQANIVLKGVIKNSMLSGVDAGAIADLNARVDDVQDYFFF